MKIELEKFCLDEMKHIRALKKYQKNESMGTYMYAADLSLSDKQLRTEIILKIINICIN